MWSDAPSLFAGGVISNFRRSGVVQLRETCHRSFTSMTRCKGCDMTANCTCKGRSFWHEPWQSQPEYWCVPAVTRSHPPPSSWLYDVSIRLWRQKWDEQHFTQKTCPRDQPPSPLFAEGFSQKQGVSGVPGWVHETTSFRSQSLASPNQHIESSSELVVKVFPTTPCKRDRNFPKSEWLRYIEYPFAANMWGWRGYVRLCPISGV